MLEPMRKKGGNSMKSRYCDFIQPHWLNLARVIGDIPQTFISRSNVWQIFFVIYVSVPAEEKRHQSDGMEMTVMKKKPLPSKVIRADGDGETTARRRHPKIVGKDPLNPKRGAPGQSLRL
jgi:hypothetical protein